MKKCHGNGKDHCCWFKGKPCIFLEEDTIPGRKWVCGLRRKLGSWKRVHFDPRYIIHIKPKMIEANCSTDCGDYPQKETKLRKDACCFGDHPKCQPYYNQEK